MANTSKSVFPALKKHKVLKLTLTGFVPVKGKSIRAYWKKEKGIKAKGRICLDGRYKKNGAWHNARLFLAFQPRSTEMVMDFGVAELRTWKSHGTLTSSELLKFCRWILDHKDYKKTSFKLEASNKVRHKKGEKLPFDPVEKGDMFVTGIRYGFSERRMLKSLVIQKFDDYIYTKVETKPGFILRSDLVNEHFFDSVLEKATSPLSATH